VLLSKQTEINVGDQIECLYPLQGCKNILKQQRGEVVAVNVVNANQYVTIRRTKGDVVSYRTLHYAKMIKLHVLT
jgi:hypothetical protein